MIGIPQGRIKKPLMQKWERICILLGLVEIEPHEKLSR